MNYKLITRVCACGCKKTFRCLETSKQKFFSVIHDKNFNFKRPKGFPGRRGRPRKSMFDEFIHFIYDSDTIDTEDLA